MTLKRFWPGLLAGCLLCLAQPALGQGKKRPLPGAKHKLTPIHAKSKAKPMTAKPVLKGPPPVISCAQKEHDFGTAVQGESVTHTYTLKNKGKGVLKIERARGG